MNAYKEDVGVYPTAEQGLKALLKNPGVDEWRGPYLPEGESLVDYWGRPLIYQIWNDIDGTPIVDVRSAGPDGVDDMGLEDDLR